VATISNATAIAASRGNPIERPFIAEAVVSLGPRIPKVPYAQPGDAARAALAPWCELVDAVLLGIDDPDEQWAIAASQFIDALNECGDAERAAAVRTWALAACADEKGRAWLIEEADDADAS